MSHYAEWRGFYPTFDALFIESNSYAILKLVLTQSASKTRVDTLCRYTSTPSTEHDENSYTARL